jgi:hypothetical protein
MFAIQLTLGLSDREEPAHDEPLTADSLDIKFSPILDFLRDLSGICPISDALEEALAVTPNPDPLDIDMPSFICDWFLNISNLYSFGNESKVDSILLSVQVFNAFIADSYFEY